MPANLTPEYREAERIFREARSDDERLRALQEMLRTIPKHKGTDKMQADIKRRIAKIRQAREKKSGKKGFSYKVPKEGAGQVVLVGTPNVGKSHLLSSLTNAEPEIAPYPFTTHIPFPGMMPFEDIKIQLVDLPPFSPEHTENWLPEMVRAADAVMFVLDLAGFPLQDMEFILNLLDRVKLELVREPDPSLPFNIVQKRVLLVCNKIDRPGSPGNFEVLKEFYGDRFDMIAVSASEGTGLEDLRRAVFDMLHVIRIYPKEPGKHMDRGEPYSIPEGSNLLDFAKTVHKDFLDMKYARLWGPSAKFDGQTINRDQVLQDGDIVELHL